MNRVSASAKEHLRRMEGRKSEALLQAALAEMRIQLGHLVPEEAKRLIEAAQRIVGPPSRNRPAKPSGQSPVGTGGVLDIRGRAEAAGIGVRLRAFGDAARPVQAPGDLGPGRLNPS
jgi:hypothetical protein